jgi:hypothetical protein
MQASHIAASAPVDTILGYTDESLNPQSVLKRTTEDTWNTFETGGTRDRATVWCDLTSELDRICMVKAHKRI